MQLTRLDDYQSWLVSHAGSCVLIDPWLTPEAISGSFNREHTAFMSVDDVKQRGDDIAAVLLCTGVSDHTRPATLAALATAMPRVHAYGPGRAVAIARSAGLRNATAVKPGRTLMQPCRQGGHLRVTVTRTGLPLGLIAVGYLIEAIDATGASQGRMWIEPHQPLRSTARHVAPVDIAILPCQAVTAVVMPVNSGARAVSRAAMESHARHVVPTATDPGRDMSGWQSAIYRVHGSRSDVSARMTTGATIRSLSAGESLTIGHTDT